MGASFLSLLMTGNGSFGDQKDKTTRSGVEVSLLLGTEVGLGLLLRPFPT